MIMRVWRGWTTEANAQALELLLFEENFQGGTQASKSWRLSDSEHVNKF